MQWGYRVSAGQIQLYPRGHAVLVCEVGQQLGDEQCSTGRAAVLLSPLFTITIGGMQQSVRITENLLEDLRSDTARPKPLDNFGDLLGRAVAQQPDIPADLDHVAALGSSTMRLSRPVIAHRPRSCAARG